MATTVIYTDLDDDGGASGGNVTKIYMDRATPHGLMVNIRNSNMERNSLRTSTRAGMSKAYRTTSSRSTSMSSSLLRHPRKRPNSLSAKLQKLSVLNTQPIFEYPQTGHPQSAQEQTLLQELGLCDFQAFLLALEVENLERLRMATGSDGISEKKKKNNNNQSSTSSNGGEDDRDMTRDEDLIKQASDLARKRRLLQEQLESLTGRDYPRPMIYGNMGTNQA